MSVFGRGKHRETDPPEWDAASLADLFEPPRTIPRRDVEGEPPWDLLPPAVDVAAGHSATWNTTGRALDVPGPAGAPARSVSPPTGPGTLRRHVAATLGKQPSDVLARAAELLPPTFAHELLARRLDEIADLFEQEETP
jgi:hypothetical protein